MFYRRFGNLLWDEVVMGARDYIGPGTREWANLPFLLCGGGRSIGLYNRFIKFVNSPNSSTSLHLREIPMKKAANLDGTGIGQEEYQRLSVAYGLSFLDIGEVITPDMFPCPPHRPNRPDITDAYIGKEQT